ncbi:MAG TPA: pantoate--beta-alanine ligase [Acidimicrobiales bacterium]|nr:pantoate--beta-alanine ligase [Acidimicrobiales bacterium]
MEVVGRLAELATRADAARRAGATVGLVPTMGALHVGHRSLIERAAAECDLAAVTIFVNPLQFGDPEDLARYPRDEAGDLERARAAGASLVVVPAVDDVYPGWPDPVATTVSVAGVSDRWEGASRPGHFDGVATVVTKLLVAAGGCRAYFGEKDFQQLAVVRRLVADLGLPVEVVGCPTVREPDGLALSSRNVRLSPDDRRAARVIPAALEAGRRAVADGERDPEAVTRLMVATVALEPGVRLDYAVVVDPATLEVPAVIDGSRPVRLLVAAEVGPARLIDNCDAPVPARRSRRPAARLAAASR